MILVTGATGLVGGNLIWHLLQKNERVTAICRSTSKLDSLRTIFRFYTPYPDEYIARIDWKIGDVLDAGSLHETMINVNTVYHCAAVVSLGNNADILLDTNVAGTRNMVEAALEAGVQKFCFVSSIAACGRAVGTEKIDEKSVWEDNQNRSLYARSKYYSEQEVWKGIEKGLNAVIVNPGVILGVSGTNSGSSQLFYQIKKGLKFYTNGGSGYVDVKDVAKVMIQLVNSEITGERFILVAENCSNKDVLSWMADGYGKQRPFINIGKRTLWLVGIISEILGKVFHFKPLIDRGTALSATNREYYSSRKIQDAIGFGFTPVSRCIDQVCKFMSQNGK
ncbi:MAG: NAD-dependent epimerase/dehydratase family protein [Paludibacter sp.]|nr:NAD-dependent epimerase/dehydratase family protein [Paludibacter sp.]